MNGSMVIQGRGIEQAEIDLIHGLLALHGDWHRTRLSRELCRRWEWRNAAWQAKDMACRSLLLKLEKPPKVTVTRKKGKRRKGAQPVHPRHERAPFTEEEIDRQVTYEREDLDPKEWEPRTSPSSLAEPYEQLRCALPKEPQLGIDETGHKDEGKAQWTWCFRARTFILLFA